MAVMGAHLLMGLSTMVEQVQLLDRLRAAAVLE